MGGMWFGGRWWLAHPVRGLRIAPAGGAAPEGGGGEGGAQAGLAVFAESGGRRSVFGPAMARFGGVESGEAPRLVQRDRAVAGDDRAADGAVRGHD